MKKKIYILILIISFITLSAAYANMNISTDNIKNASLNASSEGPIKLTDLTKEIKTHPYYENYNTETLKWMESLGYQYVFKSSNYFVIMDYEDSQKIPSVYATDVSITNFFDCKVLDNRTLVKGNKSMDVLLVEDINFRGNDTFYFQV